MKMALIYCPAVLGGCGGQSLIKKDDVLCEICQKLIEESDL